MVNLTTSPGLPKAKMLGMLSISKNQSKDELNKSASSNKKSDRAKKSTSVAGIARAKRLAKSFKKGVINKPKQIPIPLSEKEAADKQDRQDFYNQTLDLRREVEERAAARRKREQLLRQIK